MRMGVCSPWVTLGASPLEDRLRRGGFFHHAAFPKQWLCFCEPSQGPGNLEL